MAHSAPRAPTLPLAGVLLAGALALLSTAQAATFAGVDVPPPLPPQPVVDVHWGVSVEDPYRFLENTADPRGAGVDEEAGRRHGVDPRAVARA